MLTLLKRKRNIWWLWTLCVLCVPHCVLRVNFLVVVILLFCKYILVVFSFASNVCNSFCILFLILLCSHWRNKHWLIDWLISCRVLMLLHCTLATLYCRLDILIAFNTDVFAYEYFIGRSLKQSMLFSYVYFSYVVYHYCSIILRIRHSSNIPSSLQQRSQTDRPHTVE